MLQVVKLQINPYEYNIDNVRLKVCGRRLTWAIHGQSTGGLILRARKSRSSRSVATIILMSSVQRDSEKDVFSRIGNKIFH